MARSDVYLRVKNGIPQIYIDEEDELDYQAHELLPSVVYPKSLKVEVLPLWAQFDPLAHSRKTPPSFCLDEICFMNINDILSTEYVILLQANKDETHILKSRKSLKKAQKVLKWLTDSGSEMNEDDVLSVLSGGSNGGKYPRLTVKPYVSFSIFDDMCEAKKEEVFRALGPLCSQDPIFITNYLAGPAVESYRALNHLFGLTEPAVFRLTEHSFSMKHRSPVGFHTEPFYVSLIPYGTDLHGEICGPFKDGKTMGSRIKDLKKAIEKVYNLPNGKDYVRVKP